MFDPFGQWSRYLAAGNAMRSTGERAVETIDGANRVVAARTSIIGNAIAAPWSADYGELGRMLPEKIAAFARAGTAIAAVWGDHQSLWMRHMQHLGTMTMRGRPPTVAEVTDLGERTALLMLRSVEASARLGSAGLAPVRTQVRANVRRLDTSGKPERSGRRREVSH